MIELEHDMHENTKIAVDNFKKATKFCEDYNKALYKVNFYSPLHGKLVYQTSSTCNFLFFCVCRTLFPFCTADKAYVLFYTM